MKGSMPFIFFSLTTPPSTRSTLANERWDNFESDSVPTDLKIRPSDRLAQP